SLFLESIFPTLTFYTFSFFQSHFGFLALHSFPTRRSSDLNVLRQGFQLVAMVISLALTPVLTTSLLGSEEEVGGFSRTAVLYAVDRKSTRLNSSHVSISYAVFCLKKKRRYVGLICLC